MRVLCIGDVVGKPGRQAVRRRVPDLVQDLELDLVIANGENAAGGVGLTSDTAKELFSSSVDLITSGNHIWRHREIYPFLDSEKKIIRPLNYPEDAPGRGYTLVSSRDGPVGVINLVGRVFMDPVPCPFAAVEQAIEVLGRETSMILVDLHAEATSEKRAMGWFLDGKVSAMYGTHTHVATADEQILPQGTGYISDIGMTGPHDSVIGMRKEEMIQRLRSLRPTTFVVAKGDVHLCGVIFDIDPKSGKTRSVKRIQEAVQP